MRRGYSPTRRNRRIGQTQGGRVKDGRAREKWSRFGDIIDWQNLRREDLGRWPVLVENPSRDNVHPCSPDDLRDVLRQLPKRHTRHLQVIVLRRTTRQDARRGVDARRRFGCIIINAFPRSMEFVWPRTPTGGDRRHYEPWADGWQQRGRTWVLRWTPELARRYVRYHLLLHEIGHLIDTRHSSTRSRESFAENYALDRARKLRQLSV